MQCKLSICIPTYNRVGYLRECLESITPQLSLYSNEIELLISDNASTDATTSLCEGYVDKYKFIKYYKNELNIGGEANFLKCCEHSKGTYIWIIGDDDTLVPDAVFIVMEALKDEPRLITCEYSTYTNDLCNLLVKNHVKCALEKICDKDILLKNVGHNLSYISAQIFHKSFYLIVPLDRYRELSSHGFSFMFMLYFSCMEKCNARFIKKSIIKNRSGTPVAYDWEKYFIVGLPEAIIEVGKLGYLKSAVNAAKTKVLKKYIIRYFILQKINNVDTSELLKNIKKYFGYSGYFWIILLPLSYILPNVLIEFLYKKYKNIV